MNLKDREMVQYILFLQRIEVQISEPTSVNSQSPKTEANKRESSRLFQTVSCEIMTRRPIMSYKYSALFYAYSLALITEFNLFIIIDFSFGAFLNSPIRLPSGEGIDLQRGHKCCHLTVSASSQFDATNFLCCCCCCSLNFFSFYISNQIPPLFPSPTPTSLLLTKSGTPR